MRVFYSRISTSDGSQNPERQLQKIDGFDYVFTDTCSGSIPLWERPKGKQIKTLLDSNKLTHLEVHSIDRLGRDTISVLKLWKELKSSVQRTYLFYLHYSNFESLGFYKLT